MNTNLGWRFWVLCLALGAVLALGIAILVTVGPDEPLPYAATITYIPTITTITGES